MDMKALTGAKSARAPTLAKAEERIDLLTEMDASIVTLWEETHMNGNGYTRKRLNYRGVALVTSLVLLLISSAAHADVLATGAVYGGPTTHTVTCYIFNAGPTSVQILNGNIYDETGRTYLFTFNTCSSGASISGIVNLGANKICGISVDNASNPNQAWSCSFGTLGGTPLVRGVLDLRDINNNVLINSDLR